MESWFVIKLKGVCYRKKKIKKNKEGIEKNYEVIN